MNNQQQKIIKSKVGLLGLAEELGNVSRACKLMGYSRDTFYRYKAAAEEGGVEALLEKSRRGRPNLRNRTAPEVEEAITKMALEYPARGQTRVSNELRKVGMTISPAGVRSVWLRHDLETKKKRLRALEKQVAESGVILTEAQVAALETQRHEDEAHGEIETHYPGFLGSQDTMYIGALKGVGRIYQQTFVDTYAKTTQAKLYTTKTALTAADLLNDRVLPFYAEHGLLLERVLTDRGTEFCGRHDEHPYQLFLALSDIEHTKTKVKSPKTKPSTRLCASICHTSRLREVQKNLSVHCGRPKINSRTLAQTAADQTSVILSEISCPARGQWGNNRKCCLCHNRLLLRCSRFARRQLGTAGWG